MAKKKVKKGIKKFLLFIILIGLVGLGVFLYLSGSDSDSAIKKAINKIAPTTTTKPVVKIIDEDSKSRNIAVMINNISTVWGYQSGLQDAYLVYELLVEGNITRLMAVYKDPGDIEQLGTIRSARPYYLDYVLENDAVYLHIGGSPQALLDIKSLKINDLVEGAATFRVKNGLSYEHTAFASMEKIMQAISKKGYRMTTTQPNILKYSATPIELSKMEGAIPANEVLVPYSSRGESKRSFTYDPEEKVYKRFQGSKAHTDNITKKQYTAKNIITYKVKYADIANDDKGRQEMSNIGSGKGYYISEGYAVPIKWSKSSRSAQTVYTYMDGTPLIVNDGNTYFEIQPSSQELTIS